MRISDWSSDVCSSDLGLGRWMDEKGYARVGDFQGLAVPNVTDWKNLNLKYKIIAEIDPEKYIQCGLCHIACEDTAHQAVAAGREDGKRELGRESRRERGCQYV